MSETATAGAEQRGPRVLDSFRSKDLVTVSRRQQVFGVLGATAQDVVTE